MHEHVIKIRNSDRVTFKRCRRKWDWQWAHRGNLEAQRRADPLWMGTGFHFALEDFHGYKRWAKPADAFSAYTQAWIEAGKHDAEIRTSIMPADHAELEQLARAMLDYYEVWLENRDPLKTFVYKGVPQLEVNFRIELPIDPELLERLGVTRVVASGTIDRPIIDEYNRLWLVDYKSAKAIKDTFFETDPQITMYMWAASILWPEYTIAGFVYQQHKKLEIRPPEFVKSTRMFSVDKRQATTSILYRGTLDSFYGGWQKAPTPCIQFLEWLEENETDKADRFIQRNFVERNAAQIKAEGEKLIAEAYDMINPDLAIYPNPTRDCAWDCQFQTACIARDDGGDWAQILEFDMIDRGEESETWKQYLKYPEQEQMQGQPLY